MPPSEQHIGRTGMVHDQSDGGECSQRRAEDDARVAERFHHKPGELCVWGGEGCGVLVMVV